MTEKQKEDNIEVLNDIISEARNAIDNIDDYDDVDIDNVQQNFMRIEELVQDLSGYQHKVVSSTISKMIVKSLIAEISSLRLAQAPPTQTEVSLCKTTKNIQATLYPKMHQ